MYRFEADTDGTSAIVVDGQTVTGPMRLAAGAHSLVVTYTHRGGQVRFNLLWARGDETLAPVPSWALRPRRIRSLPRLIARAALDRVLALSEWVWVGLLVLAAASLARAGLTQFGRSLERVCEWRTLKWILTASFALNAAGIWWGLPSTWVAIELKPAYVLGALSQHFSHGWFDAYPPVHFYVLSAAWSPLLLLSWMDRVTFDGILGYTTLVLISRCVSLAMAAGIVVAACLCGTRAFGRRAGLIAAAIVAVVAPFLYYAKTANVDVPYLFWWAASMVFYLQLLETGRLRDYVLFAAAATLSVCTKDQAYGLYLLLPLVIVEQIWYTNRAARVPGALWRAAIDRRLIAGAVTSAALFALCQNLLFNAGGFIEHVRFIIGPGSASVSCVRADAGGTPGAAAGDGAADRDLDGLAAVSRRRDRNGNGAGGLECEADGDLAHRADRVVLPRVHQRDPLQLRSLRHPDVLRAGCFRRLRARSAAVAACAGAALDNRCSGRRVRCTRCSMPGQSTC